MSTSTKMSYNNKIMKYAITEHFAEQGKRMSNLTKAKKDNLISIIEKYNIDVEKYAKELKEQEKEAKEEAKRQAEEWKQREIQWKKRDEENKKNAEKVKKHLLENRISLTFLQKRRINMEILKQELYFKNNADKIKEGKIKRVKDATFMGNQTYGCGNFTIQEDDISGGVKIVPNRECGMVRNIHFDIMTMDSYQLDKNDELYMVRKYKEEYELKKYYLYRKSVVSKTRRKKLRITNKL